MSATVEKPPAANHTVQRLLALEPGAAFVFYRGDLAADVASSKGAPAYGRLLAEIERAAHELQAAGRIEVTERKVWVTTERQRFSATGYRALGLAVASEARDDEELDGKADAYEAWWARSNARAPVIEDSDDTEPMKAGLIYWGEDGLPDIPDDD
jgi:hypothetical protein